ncbi:MAG: DinB family protein [Firmicutes bacterium]|nr:DinB family protein [Bacillota bacterium]
MDRCFAALLKEWEFIRGCSRSFVSQMSDEDLDRELPRLGLDTLRKHFEEMIDVQNAYTRAIGTGVMEFNLIPNSEYGGDLPAEELLERMASADRRLAAALEAVTPDDQIEWFGEKLDLLGHLAALISHEAMHVGQAIAFCYALDMPIPEVVVKNWALSGR